MRRQVRQLTLAAVAALAVPALAAPPADRVEKPEFVAAAAGAAQTRPWLPATLEVTVAARNGFHVNADYPSSFKVAPGAAELRYPRARIDGTSVARVACEHLPTESCGLRLVVPYFVEKAGRYAVGGTVRFSVCDDERCLIEKIELAREVQAR